MTKESLGVPVLALGVPTVVDSSTLVKDILLGCGIKNLSNEVETCIDAEKSFFVSPKECDAIIKSICRLFASAINSAFGIPFEEYA